MLEAMYVLLEWLVQPIVITFILLGCAIAYYFGLFETPGVFDETVVIFIFFLFGLFLDKPSK